jgi:ABC-type methionine transport system ATPase subunit
LKRRVRMYFDEDTMAEPIIYNLGQQFGIVTNILSAQMSPSGGEIEVDIEGEDAAVDEALAFATSRGVRLDDITGN